MLQDMVHMLQPFHLGIPACVSLCFGALSEILDASHKILTQLKGEVT